MEEYSGYVGLDVHKETISPALANPGRSKPESLGVIANTKKSIQNLVHRLSREGEVLGFCYEAGPCGYEVYRWIKETGHDCVVVAPSLIPKKPGERVKTDRRDGLKLASLFRSGELTPVWVPDEEQEAIRDLTRARGEMKRVELQLEQRVSAFLLRYSKRYTAGKSKWTQGVLPLVLRADVPETMGDGRRRLCVRAEAPRHRDGELESRVQPQSRALRAKSACTVEIRLKTLSHSTNARKYIYEKCSRGNITSGRVASLVEAMENASAFWLLRSLYQRRRTTGGQRWRFPQPPSNKKNGD